MSSSFNFPFHRPPPMISPQPARLFGRRNTRCWASNCAARKIGEFGLVGGTGHYLNRSIEFEMRVLSLLRADAETC